MKNIIFIILVILASCATSTQRGQIYSLDEAIEFSAQKIVETLDANISIAVLNFRSNSENFSEYVIEETIISLNNKKKFKVIDRNNLDTIREEFAFQYSGDFNDDSLQRLGKWLGAEEIISGQIVDLDSVFRFRLFSLNVETAERKVGVSVDIAKTNRVLALLRNDTPFIANSSPIERTQTNEASNFTEVVINQWPNYDSRFINRTLASFSGYDNRFRLVAMPNNLNGIYSNGEYLNISIQSEQNCYIKIFVFDNNNNLKLIYPTSRMDNDFVASNSTTRIPNRNQFRVNIGSGNQYILIGAYRQSHISLFYDNNQYQIISAAVHVEEGTTSDQRQIINDGAIATTSFMIRGRNSSDR